MISVDRFSVSLRDLSSKEPTVEAEIDNNVVLSVPLSKYMSCPSYFEGNLHILLGTLFPQIINDNGSSVPQAEKGTLVNIAESVVRGGPLTPPSFAPIRTQPKRTYEPVKEIRMPEGDHVPMMLERLYSRKSRHCDSFEEFGHASGLFSSLGIRKLGNQGSDPFQIQVNPHGGPYRNLVDVGYGVSQVLPILADSLLLSDPQRDNGVTGFADGRMPMLLVQQPEVHLHPRAQAELGSFFVDLVAKHEQSVMIETHSDYLIDRVRMDIRNKRIDCDEVVILYFEQEGQGARIYPISIDSVGNIRGAPPSYRWFFLEEQRQFFEVDL